MTVDSSGWIFDPISCDDIVTTVNMIGTLMSDPYPKVDADKVTTLVLV